ncbi:TEA/ATTS domain family-domain-containing protein [Cokeromyces recurvatus]|uniref:TEA/ATTS domain family-domain-containing protein n=1 Tax=Cokeromyces recurvatus TaxID=90255 RepID=UPI00221EA0FE|nr:TEA/ATTS domain family-domain-containing protein [Cokeromyces recurvatus]KAI7902504.1 TEA/ATTS domain family-domain-containing protein [Cokeromyces recurvatus]
MISCKSDLFVNTTTATHISSSSHIKNSTPSSIINKNQKKTHLENPNLLQFQSQHIFSSQQESNITTRMNTNHKEEQVWSSDVEAVFLKALESIPKLGRRKILVNGKPCGRNELISDFIFRKTGKVRTRKQVSSHIQVLKNTRKTDPYFMRLLNDNVDEEGFNTSSQLFQQKYEEELQYHHHHQPKKTKQTKRAPRRQQNKSRPKSIKSVSTSSDESSLMSSPSQADFDFKMLYPDSQIPPSHSTLDLKDPFYEPFFGCLDFSSASITNNSMTDLAGVQHQIDEDYMEISASMQNLSNNATMALDEQVCIHQNYSMDVDVMVIKAQSNHHLRYVSKRQNKQKKKSAFSSSSIYKKQQSSPQKRKQRKSFSNNNLHMNINRLTEELVTSSSTYSLPVLNQTTSFLSLSQLNAWIDPSRYPLWPCHISLYLEYIHPYDPSVIIPHTLALLPECIPVSLTSISPSDIDSKLKCPSISELTISPAITTLFSKVKLNLNLNMGEFFFNNTCFFETQERRTIECTTTIYSFGNIVLEAKEVQQALYINEGKYIYNFVYVNQFFDAFIKGIQALSLWEEVDIAINNLCVVQIFEDVEAKLIQQQRIQQQLAQEQSIAKETVETNVSPHRDTTSTHLQTDNDDLKTCSPSSVNTTPSSSSSSSEIPTTSPLLVMMYEFERGQGTIDVSLVDITSSSNKEFDFIHSSVSTTPNNNNNNNNNIHTPNLDTYNSSHLNCSPCNSHTSKLVP